MKVTNPSALVCELIAAFNDHDADRMRELYAPGARTRRPGWPQEGGVEELITSYRTDLIAIPDLHSSR
jgi:hypothetical protein